MDPVFGIAAAVALILLSFSPVVRAIVVHTIRHPRSETVIRLSSEGKVISVTDYPRQGAGIAKTS